MVSIIFYEWDDFNVSVKLNTTIEKKSINIKWFIPYWDQPKQLMYDLIHF